MQSTVGLSRGSLEQIGILTSGLGRRGADRAGAAAAAGAMGRGIRRHPVLGPGAVLRRHGGRRDAVALHHPACGGVLRGRHLRDPRRAALAPDQVPAAHASGRRAAELHHDGDRLSGRGGDVGRLGQLSGPQPRQADDRGRRALGRHRFRPAVDRQQLRLRPDPAGGARHPGRGLDRGRRRAGPCEADQRARDADRDLRPRHPHRAELQPRARGWSRTGSIPTGSGAS